MQIYFPKYMEYLLFSDPQFLPLVDVGCYQTIHQLPSTKKNAKRLSGCGTDPKHLLYSYAGCLNILPQIFSVSF